MAATDEMVEIACRVRPDDVCLVPERREELTTEGGLDVVAQEESLAQVISSLQQSGIRVSMFIDPDTLQIKASRDVGADAIEIHTGAYAEAFGATEEHRELNRVVDAVASGCELALKVNAGHGLHYENVQRIAAISGITELNIGHSIIARAVFLGLPKAVQEMKTRIDKVAARK